MKVFFVYSSHFANLLVEEQVKVLFSYSTTSSPDKLSPDIPGGFPEVLIDSSGFQLQTGVKGVREISLTCYAMWLEFVLPKHPEISGYFNLDFKDPWDTLCNQHWFENRGLNPIPVWHDGEPQEFLDYYCLHHKWVAIGGIAKRKSAGKTFYINFNNWLHQAYPNTNFHLLGTGISGVRAFMQARPYSTDFSTWSTVARFGHGILRDDKQIIKEVRLPEADRNRLREDKEFLKVKTVEAIRNIKYFEDTLNNLQNTSYQRLLV